MLSSLVLHLGENVGKTSNLAAYFQNQVGEDKSVVCCLHASQMLVLEVSEEKPENSSLLQLWLPNVWSCLGQSIKIIMRTLMLKIGC